VKRAAAPKLIAMVGGSGAGKSWLAERLRRRLGSRAGRLSQDDFYRDRAHLPWVRRARVNFDHPRAIEWRRLAAVLNGCRAGRVVRVPHYDFVTHTRQSSNVPWHPKPIVLVEGLWLLRRPALRRLFALKIFLDCPERVRLQRRLKRDVAGRGRTAASVRRQFREMVAPMHWRFVASQRRWADIVFRRPLTSADVARLAALVRSL
jgi:uridine kinase